MGIVEVRGRLRGWGMATIDDGRAQLLAGQARAVKEDARRAGELLRVARIEEAAELRAEQLSVCVRNRLRARSADAVPARPGDPREIPTPLDSQSPTSHRQAPPLTGVPQMR